MGNLVKIGLVGCGLMGNHYAKVFEQMDEVSITACCDPTSAKLKQFSSTHNVPAGYLDYREMIEAEELDGLVNVTPDKLHTDVALATLQAGLPLMTEKPLATSMDECLRIQRTAQERKKSVIVNFSKRNTIAVETARRILTEGILGNPIRFDLTYSQGWVFSHDWGDCKTSPPWTWRLSTSFAPMGVLGDLGSHLIDLFRYISGGEVVGVSGGQLNTVDKSHRQIGDLILDSPDIASAVMMSDAGIPARILCSRVDTGEKDTVSVTVYGQRGKMRLNLAEDRKSVVIISTENLTLPDGLEVSGTDTAVKKVICSGEEVQITSERPISNYVHFIDLIRNPDLDYSRSMPGIADGCAVQAVMEAVIISAAENGRDTIVNTRYQPEAGSVASKGNNREIS